MFGKKKDSFPEFRLEQIIPSVGRYRFSIPSEEIDMYFTLGEAVFGLFHKGKALNTRGLSSIRFSKGVAARFKSKNGFGAYFHLGDSGIGIVSTIGYFFVVAKMPYIEWRKMYKEHT